MLVVILVVRLALFLPWAATRLSNGFAAHYTASRLLLEGAGVARFYDDGWFADRIAVLAGPVYDLFRPNLPTAALLLAPVAWLDYATAKVLWTLLGLAALAFSVLFLFRHLRLEGPWRPACIAGALLFQPVYEQIAQGQNYLVMLALLSVTWYGYRRGSSFATGAGLGLMLALKLLGGYVVLLLLLERRWRTLAWAAGTAAALALISLPWVGVDAWIAYLKALPEMARQPDIAATAHQTQAGFIQHLFSYDPTYSPAPLLDASSAVQVAVWAAFALVLGASAYAARRVPGSDLAFALAVMLNLILGPLSVDYQYTVMLLPTALLLVRVRSRRSVALYLLFATGVALVAVDLPYRSPRFSSGAWALLAYPKLYGAWLLWGATVWSSLRNPSYSPISQATPAR